MGAKTTFVVATYSNVESCKETLVSLSETVSQENYDVIIVDDSNNLDESHFKDFKNLKILHNPQRRGVGFSLDRGLKEAQTETCFILGDDIRFSGNWYDRFYAVVKSHPQTIMSTVCAGLNPDRKVITGKENHYFASHVIFHVTVKNNNKPALPFREYLECKWNGKILGDVEPVGAALGAFYGVSRDWFIKIRGFEGHKTWGSLEVVSALRSYIAGGNCMIDTKSVTGHLFKTASSNKPVQDLIYNKILIAKTLLPTDMEKTVIDWVKTLNSGPMALRMIERDSALISLLAGYGRESVKRFGKSNEWDEEQLRTLIKPTGILDP
jgi:glycosyltransferase involved in cell wall biosynthesis